MLALWFCGLCAGLCAQGSYWLDPARVMIVANSAMPDFNGDGTGDSMEVALRYAALRGVPGSNVFPVALSTYGTTFGSWTSFWNELRTPLIARLQALGTTNILTILFVHGVPYEIAAGAAGSRSVDQALMTPYGLGTLATPAFGAYWMANPLFDALPGITPELGHFQHQVNYGTSLLYLVARIDGPTPEAALDLVEGARYGDLYLNSQPGAYSGRIYADTRFSTYPNPASLPWPQLHAPSYGNADSDMAYATQWMTAFPLWWENTAADLEIGQAGAQYSNGVSALTAPQALFYFGWYNYATYHDVWEWLPGSAACDLNSNSVAGVRSMTPGSFGGTALRRGLTCASGCIAEPYLNGHPFPEIFVRSLLDGRTFAESAAIADPTLLWRSIAVGDPLYCPLPPGKVVVADTTPPPQPVCMATLNGSASGQLRVAVDTLGRPADPMRVEGTLGLAPVLSTIISSGSAGYRAVHNCSLTPLVSDGFYRIRPVVRDPAGLTAAAVEILRFNSSTAGVKVAAQADAAAATSGNAWGLEFALRLSGGLGSLQWLGLQADAPAYGVVGADLLPVVPQLTPVLHADGDCMSLELTVPPGLPTGDWTFRILVQTAASGLMQHAVTVSVP